MSHSLFQLSRPGAGWWYLGLAASLAYAAVLALVVLNQAFSAPFAAHPDAFQHVYWMARFRDPGLFPGDPLTDYFAAVAPPGYVGLYWAANVVGLGPITFSKLLPLPLALLTTAFAYALTLRILPVPLAGLLASVLLNQSIWMNATLASGTPRAFLYPILMAFLYGLAARKSVIYLVALIALEGLFYPPFLILMAALLVVRAGWEALAGRRDEARRLLPVLLLTGVPLAYFALRTSGYGPVLSAAEATTMPEMAPGGSREFFSPDPRTYWLTGWRSGLVPLIERKPWLSALALLLPVLTLLRGRFPLMAHTRDLSLLAQLLIASLGCFAAAHLLLFRLYLPSRYTEHTVWIVASIAAAVAIVTALQALSGPGVRRLVPAFAAALAIVAVAAPEFWSRFPLGYYRIGEAPALYQFFQRQPKDSLIATLSPEANHLPAFALRPVLMSGVANPYHLGHYRPLQAKAEALLRAHYTPDPAELAEFLARYGVDFLVVDRQAFSPSYLAQHLWTRQFPSAGNQALAWTATGQPSALSRLVDRAVVFGTGPYWVLSAARLQAALEADGVRASAASAPAAPAVSPSDAPAHTRADTHTARAPHPGKARE
jgi:hypothetical protein